MASAGLARPLEISSACVARLLEPLAVLGEQLVGLAGACARRASIDSSIACWRLSSASEIRGNASFQRIHIEIPNSSSVQIISPTLGVIRNEPLEAAAGRRAATDIYLST